MDESADREEREPDCELENLAGWYRYLVQAYPVENVGFLNSMKEVLDGFQSLRFSSDEDGVRSCELILRLPKRRPELRNLRAFRGAAVSARLIYDPSLQDSQGEYGIYR